MGETTPRRRWRLWLAIGTVVVAAGAAAAVYHFVTSSPGHLVTLSSDEGPEPGRPWFVDVTAAAGIDFVHFDPATDAHYINETMGSGVGWIDYDNDGWLDLFLVQDGPVRPAPGGPKPTCKLYRNNRDGTFTDATEKAGLA